MWVYIWTQWPERQPWNNTIAYYPLNSTTEYNDMSWNSYHLTPNGNSITYWDNYVELPWSSNGYFSGSCIIPSIWPFTINLWANYASTSNDAHCIQQFTSNTNRTAITIGCNNSKWFSWWKWTWDWEIAPITIGKRTNIAYVYENWTISFYIDNVPYTQTRTINTSAPDYLWIGSWWELSRRWYMHWKISEVIIEDVAWTAQDVEDYYNLTKNLYSTS